MWEPITRNSCSALRQQSCRQTTFVPPLPEPQSPTAPPRLGHSILPSAQPLRRQSTRTQTSSPQSYLEQPWSRPQSRAAAPWQASSQSAHPHQSTLRLRTVRLPEQSPRASSRIWSPPSRTRMAIRLPVSRSTTVHRSDRHLGKRLRHFPHVSGYRFHLRYLPARYLQPVAHRSDRPLWHRASGLFESCHRHDSRHSERPSLVRIPGPVPVRRTNRADHWYGGHAHSAALRSQFDDHG